ncbi:MAG TPA: carboxypeptidase regulatory-like domain-containing protein [Pyrinomonadaceae bacterium]|nr:carboxypeptidase regulatory-like domain-containing protein [Pyrinomonadaceae bacterium]
MRSLKIIVLIYELLLLSTLATSAQVRGTIAGFVFNPERKPIEKARVELSDGMGANRRTIETDTSGRFIFNNVGVGRYQIRVISPGLGFEEANESIEVGSTSGNETVHVDIFLKRRKGIPGADPTKVVFTQDVPEEAKRHLDAAVAAIEGNRPEAGIEFLEKAIAIFPPYFAALEILGVEYMKVRSYEKARTTFAAAVAVNARSFHGWYGLGYANMSLERFDEALVAGERAVELDKTAADAYYVIAMSQRKLKDYAASERAFLKAKEIDKGRTPEIHWNLALLYAHNLKQYGKAADELELFLKSTPDNPDVEKIRKLIASFREKQAESK